MNPSTQGAFMTTETSTSSKQLKTQDKPELSTNEEAEETKGSVRNNSKKTD
jgi:hypothetical protein